MDSSGSMSQVCLAARQVFQAWANGGPDELYRLLSGEFEIPDKLAKRFAKLYKPEGPPSEICPVQAVKEEWSSAKIFKELKLQLPSFRDEGVWPKNQLAWWIARKLFGKDVFDFEVSGKHSIGENRILFPNLPCGEDGVPVRLGMAALEVVQIGGLPAHILKKSTRMVELLGKEVGSDLARTLWNADLLFPPSREVEHLCDVVSRGLAGEVVILTGAFCPDYTYEETGDLQIPYRYTFNGVNNGVGLVAQQFVRVLPCIIEFLDKYGIQYEIQLAIGDFEANSEDILRRVGLSREEFAERCQRSLEAFQDALPGKMKLLMFEEQWANGRWKKYISEAHERMKAGDFGLIKANTGKDPIAEVVRFIARSSRQFYCDWYGRDMTEEELMALVVAQGAEYAAMGRIIAEDFQGRPVIYVAGDRPKMQAFNFMYANTPVLCAKRIY